jgi:hypothetical protein
MDEEFIKVFIFVLISFLCWNIQMKYFSNSKLAAIILGLAVNLSIYSNYTIFDLIINKKHNENELKAVMTAHIILITVIIPFVICLLTTFKTGSNKKRKEEGTTSKANKPIDEEEKILISEKVDLVKSNENDEYSNCFKLFIALSLYALYLIIYSGSILLYLYLTISPELNSQVSPPEDFLANNVGDLNIIDETLPVITITLKGLIIAYFDNFIFIKISIMLLLSKVLFLYYTPYGLTEGISSVIIKVKLKNDIKNEYQNLDNSFNKTTETIFSIQSKRQQGKSLTKKERDILNSCKEKQAILEHKHEVLEEKGKLINLAVYYIGIPLRIAVILITLAMAICYLALKAVMLYDCWYPANNLANHLNLKRHLNTYISDLQLVCVFSAYLIMGSLYGVYKLGLFSSLLICENKTGLYDKVVRNNILNLFLCVVVFLVINGSVLESFGLFPTYSYYINRKTLNGLGSLYVDLNKNFLLFGKFSLVLDGLIIAHFFLLLTYKTLRSVLDSEPVEI